MSDRWKMKLMERIGMTVSGSEAARMTRGR